MTSCSNSVRRARPLLGTYVEIEARGLGRRRLDAAVDRAFEAIATVHRLMSFQDPLSELSRLNRDGPSGATAAHPWTIEVLAAAADLKARSGGAFNAAAGCDGGIDLSGIAKGFAVDRAVEALRSAGVTRGVVNAGGDLVAFGDADVEVGVRDPAAPSRLAAIVMLRDAAFASSGRAIDPRTRRPVPANDGASVRASSCAIADALTKVVGVSGEAALPLLRHYGAAGLLFRNGSMVLLEA